MASSVVTNRVMPGWHDGFPDDVRPILLTQVHTLPWTRGRLSGTTAIGPAVQWGTCSHLIGECGDLEGSCWPFVDTIWSHSAKESRVQVPLLMLLHASELRLAAIVFDGPT
jgi:hypothetical protein